jgi:hypothetical protein
MNIQELRGEMLKTQLVANDKFSFIYKKVPFCYYYLVVF